MNICEDCGATLRDDQIDSDDIMEYVISGDILPVGRCMREDCGGIVYWYPSPIPCGHCGDRGYSILNNLEFVACCECKRFTSWMRAFEFFCNHDPLHHKYDLGKLRLVRHKTE